MNKITAAELRTILVLYQTNSFTLTGKVLHKVPTAISYTLNTLEKRLQIKLFNKDNKKLIPTVAGKYLAGKAAQILEEMDSQKAFNTKYRVDKFHEWQKYMNDEAYVVPTTNAYSIQAVNSKITGFSLKPSDANSLWYKVGYAK